MKELAPGELLAGVAYSPQVCAGEPIEIKVEPAAADEAIDVYVQGRPGTHQWMQLFGAPGEIEEGHEVFLSHDLHNNGWFGGDYARLQLTIKNERHYGP